MAAIQWVRATGELRKEDVGPPRFEQNHGKPNPLSEITTDALLSILKV